MNNDAKEIKTLPPIKLEWGLENEPLLLEDIAPRFRGKVPAHIWSLEEYLDWEADQRG